MNVPGESATAVESPMIAKTNESKHQRILRRRGRHHPTRDAAPRIVGALADAEAHDSQGCSGQLSENIEAITPTSDN
jgi:hypothetical protein